MSLNSTLIAGPWVGEFGWELFAWQGYIRALSRHHDKTIIISRQNSKAIYDDFATEFISFAPAGGLPDAFFMHNFDIHRSLRKIIHQNQIPLTKNTSLITPRRIGVPPHTHYTEDISFGKYKIVPEYICFGGEIEKKYDFIFHIRERELRKEDNWNIKNWEKLRDLLGSRGTIACIGTGNESGWIEGTADLRDIDLGELFSVLRSSTCLFGPSSGPMHLGSLCGLSHVVWSSDFNKPRYKTNWNPLKAQVLFLSKYEWNPPPQYVYKEFLRLNKGD